MGAALNEVRASSDRSACIVMASMVQHIIEQNLLLRLMITGKERTQPLFERDGSLSTFYGIIHLSYALQLIDEKLRDDLEIIRRIRNAFAHSELSITFASREIQRELTKLGHKLHPVVLGESELDELSPGRRRFVECCLSIMNTVVEKTRAFLDAQEK